MEWIELERDDLDKVTNELWGRVHRPVLGWGGRDERTDLTGLRCRCQTGCPRLFRDTQAGSAAMWRHPLCREEAHARRAVEAQGDGTYISSLLNRLL
jgi:hypothetical protein